MNQPAEPFKIYETGRRTFYHGKRADLRPRTRRLHAEELGEGRERWYRAVADNYTDSRYAPEAVYYRGVSRYSASHDGSELAGVAETIQKQIPE